MQSAEIPAGIDIKITILPIRIMIGKLVEAAKAGVKNWLMVMAFALRPQFQGDEGNQNTFIRST